MLGTKITNQCRLTLKVHADLRWIIGVPIVFRYTDSNCASTFGLLSEVGRLSPPQCLRNGSDAIRLRRHFEDQLAQPQQMSMRLSRVLIVDALYFSVSECFRHTNHAISVSFAG